MHRRGFWLRLSNDARKEIKGISKLHYGCRSRDGWTASPIQWTWTWANSRRWWGTGRPGVLQPVGSQSDMTWQINSSHSLVPSVGESLCTCTVTEKYQELRDGRLCISSVPWTPAGNPRSPHHSREPRCTLPTRVQGLGLCRHLGKRARCLCKRYLLNFFVREAGEAIPPQRLEGSRWR